MSPRTKVQSRVIQLLLTAAIAASRVPPAFAGETHDFNVPAEAAPDAIRDFASQAHVQILAAGENVKDKQLHAVNGTYSTDQGLHILLADSGLQPQYIGDRSIALVAASQVSAPPASDQPKEGKKSSSDGFRVAPVDQGASPSVGNASQSSPETLGSSSLQEVIVTAQKKEERLQDVPVPVTVLKADDLVATNLVLLQDFYAMVPGLTISQTGVQDTTTIAIRGITSAGSSSFPTTGVLVDGLPFSSSLARSSGNSIPDFDPGDLSRIEVLRGPQGTLYGASSMGGLINYVTADPSTSALSARVQAGVSDVYNGAEPGYNFRASANLPVTNTFAVQLGAFKRQDPGYIDNPVLHINGINEHEAEGGRVAFKWTPVDFLTWKVSGIYERVSSNGSDDVNIGPGYSDPLLSGGLQQDYPPNVGGYRRTVENVTSTLTISMDKVTFTSLTGYSDHGIRDSWDFTPEFGHLTCQQFLQSCNASGIGATPITDETHASKFSQEARLTGSLWSNLDWLAGTFYTQEHLDYYENILAAAPQGQIVGTWANWVEPPQDAYDESALFGDVTYHFPDHIDLQVGGRESWLRAAGSDFQISNGVLNGPVGTPKFTEIQEKLWTTANKFTFLVTPSYKLSPDDMVYVRIASGYRPGQANSPNLVTHETPPPAGPDSTVNYEVGFKGGLFDQRLFVDASVYYIDWSNIQNSITESTENGGTAFIANTGSAKSEGVEISAEAKPMSGLTISGWFAYDNAVLLSNLPAHTGYGNAGSRLPLSPKYSANFSLRQEFPLSGDIHGFAGGTLIYVGDRLGAFQSSASTPRFDYPAYTQLNLIFGAAYESWTFNGYLNNVADRRGLVGSRTDYVGFQYITPRTVGINVVKAF